MSLQKINILNRIDASLKFIVPLVKNAAIKSKLAQEEKIVQNMKSRYTDLKSHLERNPTSFCEQPPIWKIYNEATKTMVEDIKSQFRLLKNTKR